VYLSLPMPTPDLPSITETFVAQLGSVIEDLIDQRIRGALTRVFANQRAGSGLAGDLAAPPARRPRRKQLCPVPGCKNPAAPAFGMVCREHREIPGAIIKRYRAERRGDFSHLNSAG
jgi:hypothetical protein